MSLQEILVVLRRGKMWIIATTATAIIISLVVSLFILTPTYRATTTLILTKTNTVNEENKFDYNTVLLNQQLVKTYQELTTSRTIMERVINSVDPYLSYDKLKKMVKVELVGETGLFQINVENVSPRKAALIANTLSSEMVNQIPRLMKINNVEIVDKAQIPLKKYKPNILFNVVIACLLGLVAGLAFVFLRDYLDDGIHSGKDVEKYLALPNLGTIPLIFGEEKLVTIEHSHSIAAEAYRTIRTNINFSGFNQPLHSLLVTSASAMEGKSTIAANLAVAFAQTGSRVILIDADLRMPTQHKIFELAQLPGLTNVLLNEHTLKHSLQYTEVPGLSILTTGPLPPNPAELLGSENMQKMLIEARELADMVIIDTAPVVPVIDAALLASVVSGTVMVVNSSKSKIDITYMGKEQIQKSGAKILGVVLNGVKEEKGKSNSYYYYGDKSD